MEVVRQALPFRPSSPWRPPEALTPRVDDAALFEFPLNFPREQRQGLWRPPGTWRPEGEGRPDDLHGRPLWRKL